MYLLEWLITPGPTALVLYGGLGLETRPTNSWLWPTRPIHPPYQRLTAYYNQYWLNTPTFHTKYTYSVSVHYSRGHPFAAHMKYAFKDHPYMQCTWSVHYSRGYSYETHMKCALRVIHMQYTWSMDYSRAIHMQYTEFSRWCKCSAH